MAFCYGLNSQPLSSFKEKLKPSKSIFFWTRQQAAILANADSKVILYGDFGTGKSLLLHSLVLSSSEEKRSFLISGLRDKETAARGVLDISNKLRYEKDQRITTIDGRDIAGKDLRKRLDLPQKTGDDPFRLIYDLSEKYPVSNIALDEVLLEDLKRVDRIHADAFHGRLWLGLASQAFFDFQLENDQPVPDLESIPILTNQGFNIVPLSKNLRNSGKILDHSYKVQEESIIESAILQQHEVKPSKSDMEEVNTESDSVERTTLQQSNSQRSRQSRDQGFDKKNGQFTQHFPESSASSSPPAPNKPLTGVVQARVVADSAIM